MLPPATMLLTTKPYHPPADANWLAEAAAHYRGDLLAGLLVPDCAAFEEWRLIEQEELHRHAWETLERLTAYHEQRGEVERVQEYARRQTD